LNISVDATCAAVLIWTGCLVASAIASGAPRSTVLDSPEVRSILADSGLSVLDGLSPADRSRVRVIIVPTDTTLESLPRVEVYGDPSDPDHVIVLLMVKR